MIHKSYLRVPVTNTKGVLIVSILFLIINIYCSFSLEPHKVSTIIILTFRDKSVVISGINGEFLDSLLLLQLTWILKPLNIWLYFNSFKYLKTWFIVFFTPIIFNIFRQSSVYRIWTHGEVQYLLLKSQLPWISILSNISSIIYSITIIIVLKNSQHIQIYII